jgi:tetrapyrrole methylase family protein/MazG family protein
MLEPVTAEPTIHIVGLGPGDPRHVTLETRELLASGLPVLLRTRHHPSAGELAPGASDCDDLYRRGKSFDDVYQGVGARVLALAESGPMVYAVPGHPLFAERTVALLLETAKARGLAVKVYPAVSFVDLAASALGLDLGNLQVCDATELRIDAERPALIHQVFDRDTVTALKLQLLEAYPAGWEVTVLSALGSVNEAIRAVALSELDHRPFGYLDTLYVPALDPLEDVRRLDGLVHVVARLHAPGGCPWDREQTHESLRPHLLEESYEALEAIDNGDPASLTEELGDVLLQVLMHAEVGARNETFVLGDVVEHIARKLIRRHPHVFGDATASSAEQVYQNWEQLKKAEKTRESILDGVPKTLPALAASQAIQGRARRVGFDWPDVDGPLEKLREEIDEFARAASDSERMDEFGDIVFVLVNIADHLGIDAEQALRGANAKFRARFGQVERLAAARDLDLRDLDLAALDALWDEAKAAERASL